MGGRFRREGTCIYIELTHVIQQKLTRHCKGITAVCCCRSAAEFNLFVTLWTIARQAPLSLGFPRQEYWSELAFPSPGDLPDPGIEPTPAALQVGSLPLSHR